jgi:Spy/CpxP family protein refolding chaperone
MHPHVMWWARRHHRGPHESACHPGGCGPGDYYASGPGDHGAFGVRRPLRFLAHKLDLDEKQAAAVARILDELKTERAQAAVDDRRTTSSFASAFEGDTFDADAAGKAADRRVDSAKRLRDAVVKALGEIHGVLDAEQRETFAYLIRTGVLSI